MIDCDVFLSIPTTIAALMLFFGRRVRRGTPFVLLARLLLARALGGERELLGDPEVSSMSSFELRSAVLVIHVLTSWSVYENAKRARELERSRCAPSRRSRPWRRTSRRSRRRCG
jgi:hypothetical protein